MTTPNSELLGATRKANRRLWDSYWQEMAAAEADGRPVAHVFVMGSMAEIFRSFDIPMIFPEITALQTAMRNVSMDYLLTAEDQGYSPDICGYVKVDVGVHARERDHPSGKIPRPGLVLGTNVCNTYIKWSEILEKIYGCPLFVLDLPGVRFRDANGEPDREGFQTDCRYVAAQIRELIALCEQISGKKFDIDRLREIMGEVNQMAGLYRDVLEQNKNRPAPFSALKEGVVYLGVTNAFRGHPDATRFFDAALAELKEKVRLGMGAVPEEKFRLLFVGSACYTHFKRFNELFETWSGNFVHNRYLSYASGGLEKGIYYDVRRPIESLAEEMVRTHYDSMDMFFTEQWESRTVREWSIDGIVFHGVKSCRTVSTGLADCREWHSSRNTPSLLIESDLVDARLWSEAQMKNRIDAFFEALAGRKLAAS